MEPLSTENLIKAYRKEPALWNGELNSSEEEKEIAWQRLSQLFGLKSTEAVKKKIASVRSALAREMRLEEKSRRFGSGKRKTAIYAYAKLLGFLRPYIRLRPMDRNKPHAPEQAYGSHVQTQGVSAHEKKPQSRDAAQMIELNDKMNDKDWVFSLLIYNKMKEIPDGDDKDDLQLEIQRLINQTKRSAMVTLPSMPHTCFQPAQYQHMICPPTPVAGSCCSLASDALSQKSEQE